MLQEFALIFILFINNEFNAPLKSISISDSLPKRIPTPFGKPNQTKRIITNDRCTGTSIALGYVFQIAPSKKC